MKQYPFVKFPFWDTIPQHLSFPFWNISTHKKTSLFPTRPDKSTEFFFDHIGNTVAEKIELLLICPFRHDADERLRS